MLGNVFVYGKLRVCGRGFSEGKSEAGKQATNFVPAKTSNFLYTVLGTVIYFNLMFVNYFFYFLKVFWIDTSIYFLSNFAIRFDYLMMWQSVNFKIFFKKS